MTPLFFIVPRSGGLPDRQAASATGQARSRDEGRMSRRRRYAIVGTSSRAGMFDAIAGTYRETAELVGLSDLSQTRMDWHNGRLATVAGATSLPTYLADRFDRMVADTRPDTILVTTVDATHHRYITRAMELGCDVITEKPMTTDAEKMRAIFDAIARTGRRVGRDRLGRDLRDVRAVAGAGARGVRCVPAVPGPGHQPHRMKG